MIREIIKSDLVQLKIVPDNCDLFPSEYLDPMIMPYLTDKSEELIWKTYEIKNSAVAMAYCAPIELTEGTYNLYALGIHKDHQHKGIGTEMISNIEHVLADANNRLLIVETSSSDDQINARNFYLKRGYTQEDVICEFLDERDVKIIHWKKL